MRFVTYLRVSTTRQGDSGLGLEAQRAACIAYLATVAGEAIGELVEIESGGKDDRPKLAEAMALAKRHKATLLIAKLDRLSRDAAFLLGLQKAGVAFVAADNPHANQFVVGILAVVAQEERRMISVRTKAALAARKARGFKLGGSRGASTVAASKAISASADAFAASLAPVVAAIRAEGVASLGGIARALTERAIPKPRGGIAWTATDVRNVLARVA